MNGTSNMNHLQLNVAHLVATVTLNRPEVRNAFNDEMIAEVTETFNSLATRDDVRCIVLAANGTAFCAGADLNWMRSMADYTHEQNLADAGQLAANGPVEEQGSHTGIHAPGEGGEDTRA